MVCSLDVARSRDLCLTYKPPLIQPGFICLHPEHSVFFKPEQGVLCAARLHDNAGRLVTLYRNLLVKRNSWTPAWEFPVYSRQMSFCTCACSSPTPPPHPQPPRVLP